MARQNSWSVRHHPAISDVAMIAVAQPLMMLTAAVADAATGLGGRTPLALKCHAASRAGCSSSGRQPSSGSASAGNEPVGVRRMMWGRSG